MRNNKGENHDQDRGILRASYPDHIIGQDNNPTHSAVNLETKKICYLLKLQEKEKEPDGQ